ncbi:MAG TPA: polysaccharide biosynthesis tyrosine autokinase [Gammaproteobacteria bacterium]|nr:polysaccharide biosynthesis tyrosine autokinase [Gammaproteobacteria bacterium]
MNIRKLMNLINKESPGFTEVREQPPEDVADAPPVDEKVVYIENARLETVSEQAERKALLGASTQWADRIMGDILVDQGRLRTEDIDRVLEYQRDKGLYFGEAAIALKLVDKDDVLQALSSQFGYTYNRDEDALSKELVMAYTPFDEQAEEFRTIRGQLISHWLSNEKRTLAVVAPEAGDGCSYVASNLALSFSQLGHSTLLIDANLRTPRLHQIFDFSSRIGLSMLLAGRVKLEQLDMMPDKVSNFQHLSVLGCGAVPPNPAELLGRGVFPLILREIRKYFDVVIIDTPPASYQSDILSIASAVDGALLVTRGGHSKLDDIKVLMSMLDKAGAPAVGAVLNQY